MWSNTGYHGNCMYIFRTLNKYTSTVSILKSTLSGLVYNKHNDNLIKGYLSCLREPRVFLCGHVVDQRSKIYKDWVVTRHSVLLPMCTCLAHCRCFQDNEAMGSQPDDQIFKADLFKSLTHFN